MENWNSFIELSMFEVTNSCAKDFGAIFFPPTYLPTTEIMVTVNAANLLPYCRGRTSSPAVHRSSSAPSGL